MVRSCRPYTYHDVTYPLGDHIFGLIPLLASCLNGGGGTSDGVDDPRLQVDMDQRVCVSDDFLSACTHI